MVHPQCLYESACPQRSQEGVKSDLELELQEVEMPGMGVYAWD